MMTKTRVPLATKVMLAGLVLCGSVRDSHAEEGQAHNVEASIMLR